MQSHWYASKIRGNLTRRTGLGRCELEAMRRQERHDLRGNVHAVSPDLEKEISRCLQRSKARSGPRRTNVVKPCTLDIGAGKRDLHGRFNGPCGAGCLKGAATHPISLPEYSHPCDTSDIAIWAFCTPHSHPPRPRRLPLEANPPLRLLSRGRRWRLKWRPCL